MSGGYSCPRHVYCGLSLGDALVTATRHVTPRSRERNSEILAEISDHGVWNLVHLCQGRDAAPTQGNQFPGINRPCMYFVRLFVSVAESPSLCLFGLKPIFFESFSSDAGRASSFVLEQAADQQTVD
jgi:hypothetical protein